MSFSQMTHRLFEAEPFIGSTPIHSLADPWLGIGIQLVPIPQALLQILLISVPSYCISIYCVPALVGALVTEPQDDVPLSSLLRQLSKLWLSPMTLLSAIKSSSRRNISNAVDRNQLHRYQTNIVFTSKQGRKMMRRFQRFGPERGPFLLGQWDKFLQGRNRIILDDVSSELTSQSGNRTVKASRNDSDRGAILAPMQTHHHRHLHLQHQHDQFEQSAGDTMRRFFLFAEVERAQNAARIRREMMAMLETDWQGATSVTPTSTASALPAAPAPIPAPESASVLSQDVVPVIRPNREQIRRSSDSARRQTEAERVEDDLAERRQARLLNDDNFPLIGEQFENTLAGIHLDTLRTFNDSSSAATPTYQTRRF